MQFSQQAQQDIINFARTNQAELMKGEVLIIPGHGNLYIARSEAPPTEKYGELGVVKIDTEPHYLLKRKKGDWEN